MMAQYVEIKAANPDSLLFYRMGDFYELFFEDAEIASRALGIVLTKRGKHQGQDIPMCGVPVERADDYLQRLIGLGHRVAVCEQTEDPAEAKKRGPKSVVRRDVVRLVTPGTITEERLLEPGRANYLLAIARRRVSDTQLLLRARRSRHLHRSFCPERDGRHRPFRRDRPLRAARDPGAGRDPRRSGPEKLLAGDAGLDHAAAPRRPRSGFRRAAAQRIISGSRPSTPSAPSAAAEITAAGSALFYIEKTQIDSRPVAQPALPRHLRRGACHRCGDPRQPRTHPDPVRASGPAACSPPSIAR